MMWTLYSHSFDSVHTLELKEEFGGGGAIQHLEHSLELGGFFQATLTHARCDLCVFVLNSVTFGSRQCVEASGFSTVFFFFLNCLYSKTCESLRAISASVKFER